jgi:dihydrofolate synthase / folylpolyglutamate synthase
MVHPCKSLDDWLAFISGTHVAEIELGLSRVSAVYERMSIRSSLPYVITVGGTNGKGSTVAAIEKALLGQGLKVGAYTSPHIDTFNERVRINGINSNDQLLIDAFQRVEHCREGTSLTYFEYSTLAAFQVFASLNSGEGLDVLLCEVGLGGRLDAVNILDADIAVVTSIGLDHVDWLGNSIEGIAREKAGIFRSASAALVGETFPIKVLHELESKFPEQKLLGRDFGVLDGDSKRQFKLLAQAFNVDQFDSSLPLNNLMLALQVCIELFELVIGHENEGRSSRFESMCVRLLAKPEEVFAELCQAIESCTLPGRIEVYSRKPLTILDVGHNAQAAQFLAEYISLKFPGAKVFAVFSCLKDKDIHAILTPLLPVIDRWYVAPLAVERAFDQDELESAFNSLEKDVDFKGSIEDSMIVAQRDALAEAAVLLVFGSFYVVESARRGFRIE